MVESKRKSTAKSPAGAKRAKAATEHTVATHAGIPDQSPLASLLRAVHNHQEQAPPKNGNVVHWFRSDLRLQDNRGLHAASRKAKENGKALIALYVVSPQVNLMAIPLTC